MRVYIAGPVAGRPLHVRQKQFETAERKLAKIGHDPVNPLKNDPLCEGGDECPGPKERPKDHHARSCYLKWDIVLMLQLCDGVALMDGWEKSEGASWEEKVAKHCGLDVRPLKEWL